MNYKRVIPGRNAPCLCGSGRKYKKCCVKQSGAPIEIELQVGTYEYSDALTGSSSTYIIREGHGKYHGHREDIQKTHSRTHTGLLLAGLLPLLDPGLEGLQSYKTPPRRTGRPGTGQRRPPGLKGL